MKGKALYPGGVSVSVSALDPEHVAAARDLACRLELPLGGAADYELQLGASGLQLVAAVGAEPALPAQRN